MQESNKTRYIFITVPEAVIARNLLEVGNLHHHFLNKMPREVFVLLVPEKYVQLCSDKYADSRILIESVPISPPSLSERLLSFLNNLAFGSGANILMRERGQGVMGSHIPVWVYRLAGKLFFHSSIYLKFLRRLYLYIRPNRHIESLFLKYRPVCVFSTLLLNQKIDQKVCLSARKHDIPIVGMVRSWDNLSSQFFISYEPDLFLVQNRFLYKEAVEIHKIPSDKIKVVGFPQYDLYTDKSILKTKETFFKQWNLDLNKRLIVYGAVGEDLFPGEWRVAHLLEQMAIDNKFAEPVQIIYRPHPFFHNVLTNITNLRNVKTDPYILKKNINAREWGSEKEDTIYLINLLTHTDVVITTGSTLLIESAIAGGTPSVNIGFNESSSLYSPHSPAQIYRRFRHLRSYLKFPVSPVASSVDELALKINQLLNQKNISKGVRYKLLYEFGGILDGHSSSRIAEEIRTFLKLE